MVQIEAACITSETHYKTNVQLVSWYFELSQPQMITSRLKAMFNLFPIYSARKTSNHKLSKIHKISPDTTHISWNGLQELIASYTCILQILFILFYL